MGLGGVDADLSLLSDAGAETVAAAYRLPAPDDLGAAAQELASQLGIVVTPVRSTFGHGDEGFLFDDDGGSQLFVYDDGSWYYSGHFDAATYDCVVVPGAAGDDGEQDPAGCTLVTLDPDRTVELAQDWVTRLGLDGLLDPIRASESSGSYTETQLLVEGRPSGVWFGFGFAADEQLAYAYGQLATPVVVGDYPLITPTDTARRLAAGLDDWYLPAGGVLRPESATFELVLVTDVEGTWWLLPGYRFLLADGETLTEQALTERYVRYSQYPEFADGPGWQDDELVEQAALLADLLVTLEPDEATAAETLDATGLPWRVVRRDDEWLAVTMDYIGHRLNLEIDDGVVTVVTLG
jgi:hypothetical protein